MKKAMSKVASGGIVLHNSSPAAIEHLLVSQVKEALGPFADGVNIKPFLQVENDDPDLTGNVTNAFGAMLLNVSGIKLYLPFVILDKQLLPFDSIRMGDQEIAYDYSKLRRIVNAIDHKVKTTSKSGDDPFKTMEVVNFKDVQPNNGFLGTIMGIRDAERNRRGLGGAVPWEGPGFGTLDDARLMDQTASIDVLDQFHNIMEKIANVKVFSEKDIQNFESHLEKKAEAEEQEAFEKTAGISDTMETAKLKREIVKLSEEQLFNAHRAASGNNIAFPTFSEGQFSFSKGRIYKQFESWVKNTPGFTSKKFDAVILDSNKGYAYLKKNEPFMASLRDPAYFELQTEAARGLEVDKTYSLEKDQGTLYSPFTVTSSYLEDVLNDGMVISVRERASINNNLPSQTNNSLIYDVKHCSEIIPGTQSRNLSERSYTRSAHFQIVVVKSDLIKEPTFMTEIELTEFVSKHARDSQDARLARRMFGGEEDTIVVPEDTPFFKMERRITDYYTRPDGLFKEGPLAKTAAYQGQNKATLVLQNQREPKQYMVKWQFTRNQSIDGNVPATNIERRSISNLSQAQAQEMLQKLGFDHRTQTKFFEIVNRNGREATFSILDKDAAATASFNDTAKNKAVGKMKGIANAMLHSKNFMPMFEDNLANGLSAMIAGHAPGSIDKAHKLSDAMDWKKQSFETAVEIEKLATRLNGPEWHEISALLNLKHQLDKLATQVYEGSYLYKADEVFEKVAELKPVIEKKAHDLIDFNRKQKLKTTSYLIQPKLIKEALYQLDGLYTHASRMPKKKADLTKTAGLFNNLGETRRELGTLEGDIGKMKKDVQSAENKYKRSQALFRSQIESGGNVINAKAKVDEAEKAMNDKYDSLRNALQLKNDKAQTVANKNKLGVTAIGVPGLMALSYQNEKMKKNR